MKKVFISQPIDGKVEEIKELREKTVKYLESQGYEVINKTYEDEIDKSNSSVHPELKIIGKNIQDMTNCDAIYCTTGWSLARNCRVERITALLYGIEILNSEEK